MNIQMEAGNTSGQEQMNMSNDMNMAGTGIGNSAPNQNLDERRSINDWTKKYEDEAKEFKELNNIEDTYRKPPEETKEKPTTQGRKEQDLVEYEKEYERLEESYNKVDKWRPGMETNSVILNWAKDYLSEENYKKAQDLLPAKGVNVNAKDQQKVKDMILKTIANKQSDLRDKTNEIKDGDFDNRSDEQKREDDLQSKKEDREDSAYDRAVQDMRKAGLNPGLMFGGGGPAGSSGGSSAGDSKEDKRRKRKKEALERERLRQQQQAMIDAQNQQAMIRMFGGMINMAMLGSIRRPQYKTQQQDMSKYLTRSDATKAAMKQNEWNRKNFKWKDV